MSTAEAPVREGDLLAGKYRVEKVLGVGGMGVVVAAMHTELDQRVALKFLLPEAAKNAAVVARFQREARAAAKIRSEHVCRVMDVGAMDTGLPYIVMELLEGSDLSDLVEKHGKLPVVAVVDYLLEACEALAEAHAAGFVHRDLKPANLFLARQADGGEIVKVLDFGISKSVLADEAPGQGKGGALTQTSDVFGSPMYMSPEQLKSAKDVDARSDVWSLGVILYELLTGKPPFERNTVAETFGAILYEEPPSARSVSKEIPAGLDAVIKRCLQKNAAARFPNVADLAEAIAPFGSQRARISVDRTSRVLRRAGVSLSNEAGPMSGAPPSLLSSPPSLGGGSSPGAGALSAWGSADAAPKPAGSKLPLFIGLGLGLVGGAFVIFYALRTPTGPAPAASAERPAASAPAVPTAAPTAAATATPTVAPVETAAPSAAAAPADTAPAGTSNARGPSRTGKGKLPGNPPAKDPAGVSTTGATGAAPQPPAPPPARPIEDPDGFGDRK